MSYVCMAWNILIIITVFAQYFNQKVLHYFMDYIFMHSCLLLEDRRGV